MVLKAGFSCSVGSLNMVLTAVGMLPPMGMVLVQGPRQVGQVVEERKGRQELQTMRPQEVMWGLAAAVASAMHRPQCTQLAADILASTL